ncbi:S49 family peptidase [uncultured Draconibacterium sp.]|uniref:S49 family peptidase n=1 Tax=uncultured Draconibacterium sp. TaxID=1573823 RepID=UPI0025D45623|nr:S49 family peptidase [uncultured Draconibacterium sp.]
MKLPYLIDLTLNGSWAIEPNFSIELFNAYLPYFQPVSSFVELEQAPEPEENLPYAFGMPVNVNLQSAAQTGKGKFAARSNTNQNKSIYDDAPPGSVAIIPVRGAMTKYTQLCGPAGTTIAANRIAEADRHKNIVGVIVFVESGGGQLESMPPIFNAINACNKPLAALYEDFSASAALISTSGSDLVVASNPMVRIGSMGVMGQFQNNEKALKERGWVIYTYKSTYSYNKNKNTMEAIQGDGKNITKQVLDPFARYYLKMVADNRGAKLRDNFDAFIKLVDQDKIDKVNADNVFSAEMFFAKDCLPGNNGNGLIDRIGSLAQTVEWVKEMAKKQVKINF